MNLATTDANCQGHITALKMRHKPISTASGSLHHLALSSGQSLLLQFPLCRGTCHSWMAPASCRRQLLLCRDRTALSSELSLGGHSSGPPACMDSELPFLTGLAVSADPVFTGLQAPSNSAVPSLLSYPVSDTLSVFTA